MGVKNVRARPSGCSGCFDAILMRFAVGCHSALNGDIFIKMLADNKTMFDERDVVNSPEVIDCGAESDVFQCCNRIE